MDKTLIVESKKTIVLEGVEYDTYDARTAAGEIISNYFATSGKVLV
jgi:hypothetical protein